MAPEYTSAAELARRIRRRELSPVEVLEATIARIEVRNPSLNALVHLAVDEARAAARTADRALAAGSNVGPLHGVPAALKDLMDSKLGWPSTCGGIRALRDHTPAVVHAVVGERLDARARSSSARATARSWASAARATTRSTARPATRST